MLTILLFFLGLGTTPYSAPADEQGSPTMIVQVVDPVWIPLPDAEVTVKPADGKGSSKSAHTDANGFAKFWVDTGVAYRIEAKTEGFNAKVLKSVMLTKPKAGSPPAHIQLKLEPKGPFTSDH
jgi:hypothetical protein